MARSKIILQQDAKRFREAIRPSLVGNLARIEPLIATRAAEAASDWLFGVVSDTMRTTSIADDNGHLTRQLRGGIRVTGRNSLAALRASIWTYPWVFAHEYGARPQPRNAQYIAIPIFYGLRPDGKPKFRSPRAWNRYGSFVYTSKRTGKKYLAYRSKETKELRILYVLVDETEIPPRLGLNRMADRQLGTLLAAWGTIYLSEMSRTDVINLWGARP